MTTDEDDWERFARIDRSVTEKWGSTVKLTKPHRENNPTDEYRVEYRNGHYFSPSLDHLERSVQENAGLFGPTVRERHAASAAADRRIEAFRIAAEAMHSLPSEEKAAILRALAALFGVQL